MENKNFKPNTVTFEDGLKRIEKALQGNGVKISSAVVTSKDQEIQPVLKALEVTNVPDSFKKWQLPFSFDRAQIFISVGSPGSKVPEHSHDEGAGIRYIATGSIRYKDKVLNAGDWMYIPKGAKYSFVVGDLGATMFYCYSCCCA